VDTRVLGIDAGRNTRFLRLTSWRLTTLCQPPGQGIVVDHTPPRGRQGRLEADLGGVREHDAAHGEVAAVALQASSTSNVTERARDATEEPITATVAPGGAGRAM
jgi:hypothetical protein